MPPSKRIVFTVILFSLASSARADTFDVVTLLGQVPHQDSASRTLALILAVMLANYVINLAAIGLPASHFLRVPTLSLWRRIAWLTRVGQVVDRVGFLLSAFASALVQGLLPERAKLPVGLAVAGAAAFLTNPMWVMMLFVSF